LADHGKRRTRDLQLSALDGYSPMERQWDKKGHSDRLPECPVAFCKLHDPRACSITRGMRRVIRSLLTGGVTRPTWCLRSYHGKKLPPRLPQVCSKLHTFHSVKSHSRGPHWYRLLLSELTAASPLSFVTRIRNFAHSAGKPVTKGSTSCGSTKTTPSAALCYIALPRWTHHNRTAV